MRKSIRPEEDGIDNLYQEIIVRLRTENTGKDRDSQIAIMCLGMISLLAMVDREHVGESTEVVVKTIGRALPPSVLGLILEWLKEEKANFEKKEKGEGGE